MRWQRPRSEGFYAHGGTPCEPIRKTLKGLPTPTVMRNLSTSRPHARRLSSEVIRSFQSTARRKSCLASSKTTGPSGKRKEKQEKSMCGVNPYYQTTTEVNI